MIHSPSNWPVDICVITPTRDVGTNKSRLVEVATLVGTRSRYTNDGTCMTPPPMPKKLDTNPTAGLIAAASFSLT